MFVVNKNPAMIEVKQKIKNQLETLEWKKDNI